MKGGIFIEELKNYSCKDPVNDVQYCIETSHLDNSITSVPSVQMPLNYVASNGCRVRLVFASQSIPGVRDAVARILLDASMRRRSAN